MFFSDLAPLPIPSLREILSPLTVEQFRKRYLGKKFIYIEGETDRFASLFRWDALNEILRSHRLEPPRIRLSDLSLPASSFIRYASGPGGTRFPKLDSAELQRLLREGATLVIDAVDELHIPSRALADHLERQFLSPVQANLYTGWRQSQGFGTHWDGHDVLVLQVHGRKRWRVHGVSRPSALDGDSEPESNIPAPAAWEGYLESGDVLYIPRGWWHDAVSAGEPTLHLTFGLNPDTGLDYLQWLLTQLREKEVVRRDLPRFAPPAARKRYGAELRQAVVDAFDVASAEKFFEERDIFAPVRTYASFPWSAHPERFPLAPNTWLRAIYTRPPGRSPAAKGSERVRLLRREWILPTVVARLLEELTDGRPRRLCDLNIEPLPRELLAPIVTEWIAQGILEIVEPWWSASETLSAND